MCLNNMVTETQEKKEWGKTIRVSKEVYDYIDKKAEGASDTFDRILRRLLKIK